MKKQSTRILIWGLLGLIIIFGSLTLAGRKVGDHPLPWHLAWMACFGEDAWWTGFELTCRKGKHKHKILDQFGTPDLVLIDGESHEPAEVDLLQNRDHEMWGYYSPFSSHSGPTIYIENDLIVAPPGERPQFTSGKRE